MNFEEFLAWEDTQDTRHEFVDGDVFAMTGDTLFHNHITLNLAVTLRQQLKPRGCITFAENAKLRVGDDLFYPDIVVTCDPHQFDRALVEQPILVAEVLSPGTAAYDRNVKWTHYQRLPSLQTFLLASQDALRVEVFRRTRAGWDTSVHAGPHALFELSAPPCRLSLADVYDGLLDRLT
jgi:Uma2 family endonuclease